MRDLVVAQGVGDLDPESREVRSGVFEGGPHHVPQFGVLGGAGRRGGLVEFYLGAGAGLLLFGCALRPKVGDHIGAVCAIEGLAQAGLVVEVCLDDLNPLRGEFTRPARVGIAGQRPRCERTRRVGEDRPDQTAALRTDRAHYSNDFLVGRGSVEIGPDSLRG
jgi:hypothetical protein